jgi:hypothetical protein
LIDRVFTVLSGIWGVVLREQELRMISKVTAAIVLFTIF